jgi:hypothetical protein
MSVNMASVTYLMRFNLDRAPGPLEPLYRWLVGPPPKIERRPNHNGLPVGPFNFPPRSASWLLVWPAAHVACFLLCHDFNLFA